MASCRWVRFPTGDGCGASLWDLVQAWQGRFYVLDESGAAPPEDTLILTAWQVRRLKRVLGSRAPTPRL